MITRLIKDEQGQMGILLSQYLEINGEMVEFPTDVNLRDPEFRRQIEGPEVIRKRLPGTQISLWEGTGDNDPS